MSRGWVVPYEVIEGVQFDLTEGRVSAGAAAVYAKANDPVDFAHQIAALIDDPARRARMGKLGRERVLDHLSWAHSAPLLLAAYDRIFAKADHAARHGTTVAAVVVPGEPGGPGVKPQVSDPA